MDLSLQRIDAALSTLKPKIRGEVIHIAGTNGKGSTALFIANILQAEGFSVALFTSPHIISIYERLQYNSGFISPEEFDELFSNCKDIIIENKLTYFESLFALFMLYSSRKDPDFLVLETGLGGRFDATNTNYIKKKYPVITQISLDHGEILGENIYGILSEKLAVIKDNSPVFAGLCKDFIMNKINSIPAEVISPSQADILHALQYAPPPFNSNLALAQTTVKYICKRDIAYKSYPLPPCRQERFGRIILDGAHNAAGILTLKKRFPKIGGALISSTKERNIKRFIHILSSCTRNIIATSIPDNQRSIDGIGLGGIRFIEEPIDALNELDKRSVGDILVTGSLYLCSFIRKLLLDR
ncbi:MAG: hypothetical protein LBP51_06990 [Deferribacteraceae bacterium]|jgi:dihydrofolate synthase/folylpolyglutamate synthase|nr:hypothetical protein [Deferribacteraceae bacterium]